MAIDPQVLALIQAGVDPQQAWQIVSQARQGTNTAQQAGPFGPVGDAVGNVVQNILRAMTPEQNSVQGRLNSDFNNTVSAPLQDLNAGLQSYAAGGGAPQSAAASNPGQPPAGQATPPQGDDSNKGKTASEGDAPPSGTGKGPNGSDDSGNQKGPNDPGQPPAQGGPGAAQDNGTSAPTMNGNGTASPAGAADLLKYGLGDRSPEAWGRSSFENIAKDNGMDLLGPLANSPFYSFVRNRFGDQAAANATTQALTSNMDTGNGTVDWARSNLGLNSLGGGAPAGGAEAALKNVGGLLTQAMGGDSSMGDNEYNRLRTFGDSSNMMGQNNYILQSLRQGTGGWGLQALSRDLQNLGYQSQNDPSAFTAPGSYYQKALQLAGVH